MLQSMLISRKIATHPPPNKPPQNISIFTFNLSVTWHNSLQHISPQNHFLLDTLPYIFVLSWITDCTHVLSPLFPRKSPFSRTSLYSMLCQHEMTLPVTFADHTTISSKILRWHRWSKKPNVQIQVTACCLVSLGFGQILLCPGFSTALFNGL